MFAPSVRLAFQVPTSAEASTGFGGVLGVDCSAGAVLPSALSNWADNRSFGFNRTTIRLFIMDSLKGFAISVVIGDKEFRVDNFKTVAALAAFVRAKLEPAA